MAACCARFKLPPAVLLVGILFCLAIGYAAWVLAYNATHAPDGSWRLETSGSSWNQPLPAFTKIVVLVSIALMAVQQVVRIATHRRARLDGDGKP